METAPPPAASDAVSGAPSSELDRLVAATGGDLWMFLARIDAAIALRRGRAPGDGPAAR